MLKPFKKSSHQIKRHQQAKATRTVDSDARFLRANKKRAQTWRRFQKNTASRVDSLRQVGPLTFWNNTKKNVKFQRGWHRAVLAVAVLGIIGNVLQYSRYSPSRPLVTIGHRVIPQRVYLMNLDNVAGKSVLNQLVYDTLIHQAAVKAGVMPTPEDVDARVALIKQHATQALPPDAQLWDETRLQMEMENLRMRGITASNAEIAAFYAQNKAAFATPERVKMSMVVTKDTARASQAASLLASGQTEAQIATHPGLMVVGINGFNVNLNALPPQQRANIQKLAMTLPVSTTKIIQIGPKIYLTLMTRSRTSGTALTLAQASDQVSRMVRLQKAPSETAELALLYHANPPKFDMPRYAQYFTDISNMTPPVVNPPTKTASLPPNGVN